MKVAFASDHAGWPLRERILTELAAGGFDLVDCGSSEPVPGDDYPDVAAAVGRAVAAGRGPSAGSLSAEAASARASPPASSPVSGAPCATIPSPPARASRTTT